LENLPGASADTALDPVCGMTVKVATAKHHHGHAGKTYYFCSQGDKEQFDATPDKFATLDKL